MSFPCLAVNNTPVLECLALISYFDFCLQTQPPNAGGLCGGGGRLAMFQKRLPTNDNSTVAVPTATAVAASQPEDELPPQESQTAPVTAGGVPDAAALTNVHQPTQRTDEDVSMEEPTESFSPRLSYRIRKRDEIGAHTCHMDALGGKHVDTPRAAAAEMPPEEEPYQEEKEPEDTPRTMVAATGVFQGQNNVQVHPLVTPGLRADAGSVVVQPATATTQTRDYDVQLSDKDNDWDQYKWEEGQKDFATKDQKAGDLLETFEEEYWQGLSTLETAYSSLLKLQHDTFDSLNETAEMEAMVDWLLAEHEAY